MSASPYCLNCENELKGSYCERCGQKVITHRPSLIHFISHDLPHAIFHLDKGFLFTIKEVIIRPGYSAKEYIAGKRARHYNIFALIIIMIGFTIFIDHYIPDAPDDLSVDYTKREQAILDFIAHNAKPLIFFLAPLFALASFTVYRRTKYNYTEHLIAAAFALAGILVINLIWDLLDWKVLPAPINSAPLPVLACMLLYMAWVYYQLTRPLYRFGGYVWRTLCFLLLIILMLLFLLALSLKAPFWAS